MDGDGGQKIKITRWREEARGGESNKRSPLDLESVHACKRDLHSNKEKRERRAAF